MKLFFVSKHMNHLHERWLAFSNTTRCLQFCGRGFAVAHLKLQSRYSTAEMQRPLLCCFSAQSPDICCLQVKGVLICLGPTL